MQNSMPLCVFYFLVSFFSFPQDVCKFAVHSVNTDQSRFQIHGPVAWVVSKTMPKNKLYQTQLWDLFVLSLCIKLILLHKPLMLENTAVYIYTAILFMRQNHRLCELLTVWTIDYICCWLHDFWQCIVLILSYTVLGIVAKEEVNPNYDKKDI